MKLNKSLIRGKLNMVNTTGVRCVSSQMMLSDTAYTNLTLKFLNRIRNFSTKGGRKKLLILSEM